ncbi:conserved hypothetical protein [Histoplasma capsulatum var. duboisii H88]|uniref:Flavoprotein superfamily domain-containing protein n=2 Tax=Ajellomyces capsulatus TaxID=5037 RepID=F0UU90_AJEC8|nr:conserved hypothetical protein [Histoplasma capsulatum H143]EGC49467.1 conserved hypothetical protein [Histoplasma capsulatum var. duboisii H88]QSS57697.1 flavoprotein superfamily domain-containing protein [Histoplasma capsulatum var. duboisii H88]
MAVDFTLPHALSPQYSQHQAPRDKVTAMPGVALTNGCTGIEIGADTRVYENKNGATVSEVEVELNNNNGMSSADPPCNKNARKHVLLSTNASFAKVAIPFLLKMADVELRVISDDALDFAQGACYPDTPISAQPGSKLSTPPWMNVTAAELIDWADVLVLGSLGAGTLGAMIAGLTTSLTLTILRGWDISKRVFLVPGMTTSEWQFPMTKRQLSNLATFWPLIKVLPPTLSKFEHPAGLVEIPWDGWTVFSSEVRNACSSLPGPMQEDNKLANNACSGTRSTPLVISSHLHERQQETNEEPNQLGTKSQSTNAICKERPILPPELLTMIFEMLGDWETATSVGVYAKIPVPEQWKPYIPTARLPATFEYIVLRGSIKEIEEQLSTIPPRRPLSRIATDLILKFSRTDILDTLCRLRMDLYLSTPDLKNLPLSASSKFGSTSLLTWWHKSSILPTLPIKDYLPEAIDAASRAGFVDVLEWWRQSGLPFRYTERSLESASAEGQIAVLDWWKTVSKNAPLGNPVPLKVGKSVLLAAQSGRTDSLAWWDKSDIPFSHSESVTRIASNHGHVPVLDFWHRRKREKLIFDNQVLVGATKNGHVEVLEWWKRSGLPVEFKTCDIEEALEDAVSGVEQRVRRWWAQNGLNLGVGTNEWMMVKTLNT